MEHKFKKALFFKGGGGSGFWKILTGRLRRGLKDKRKVSFKETSAYVFLTVHHELTIY